MKRSMGIVSLVLLVTAAGGAAATSSNGVNDRQARATGSPSVTLSDFLKGLRLETMDEFDEPSGSGRLSDEDSDSGDSDTALVKSKREHTGGSGSLSDEDSDSDIGPPVTGPNHAPSQPIPEPISGLLFAAGALVVGYAVRRPLMSDD